MDIFPMLRRLPRRMLLCLYITCACFAVCALIALYLDGQPHLTPTIPEAFETEQVGGTHPSWNKPLVANEGIVPPERTWRTGSSINLTSEPGVERKNKYVPSLHHHPFSNVKYIYITSPTLMSTSTTVNPSKRITDGPVAIKTTGSPDTCQMFTMKHSKLILLWTPFFDYWGYFSEQNFAKCARCRNCRVTTDRSQLADSDAVVFHCRDMSVADLPAVRYPHQRWIFYCLESPPYSDFAGLRYARNLFNWTMTYRRDSDVVSQYGSVSKVNPPKKLDLDSLRWSFGNKSRSVVWVSSHCSSHGGRDVFVSELQKYIDLDVFGSCGGSVCPKDKMHACLLEFASKYKFFLAFENSICRDYVTEKFFKTLRYDIVPVVFGGAEYDRVAPPESYVDALSFKSPKHLAFFLAGVGRDFRMYSNYFRWRSRYAVSLSSRKECDLCALLHRTDLKGSTYSDFREWWVTESRCWTWKPKR